MSKFVEQLQAMEEEVCHKIHLGFIKEVQKKATFDKGKGKMDKKDDLSPLAKHTMLHLLAIIKKCEEYEGLV